MILGKHEDERTYPRDNTMHRFMGLIMPRGDCWEWQGKTDKDGYGVFSVYREPWRAHRFSYLIFVTEFTPNKVLDHLCRNRACVNPDHLEEVTYKENIERGVNKLVLKNKALAKTHCRKGHELTPDNIYSLTGRDRCCRACKRIGNLRWYHKTKGLTA